MKCYFCGDKIFDNGPIGTMPNCPKQECRNHEAEWCQRHAQEYFDLEFSQREHNAHSAAWNQQYSAYYYAEARRLLNLPT